MTLPKRQVMDLIRELPDDVNVDELIYRLYLLQKLAAGEADATAGRILPLDEVRRQALSWRR